MLWELVAEPGACILSVADLPALARDSPRGRASHAAPTMHAPRSSAALLDDGIPSLIFTVAPRNGSLPPRSPRRTPAGVVQWLDCRHRRIARTARHGARLVPERRASQAHWRPTTSSRTDVAAEGLDLARLRRVVHYDLPWTPARVEQREGRSRRGTNAHLSTSHVVPVSPALEQRLQLGAILDRKRALPARVGVGGGDESIWRWREALARDLGDGPRIAGVAAIAGIGAGAARRYRDRGSRLDAMAPGIVVGRSAPVSWRGHSSDSEAEAVPMLRWAATAG